MQDFRKLMKQAKEMQERMAQMQEQLSREEVDGSAGGGMVTVRMNGRHEIVKVTIDKQVVDPEDVEMLEDLIAAAVNDARTKVEEKMQGEMGKLTGGLGMPGLF
ncbi:MAG: YbaB/EbfC family nucleoid-associated protein [Candidatus Eisenbacteria bacterium]